MSSLQPDIDVTARAITRLVNSLTGDTTERVTIITLAASIAAADALAAMPTREKDSDRG